MKELIKQSTYIWNCCKVLVTWIAICEASCHTKFLVFYFACFNLLVFYIIYIYIYEQETSVCMCCVVKAAA